MLDLYLKLRALLDPRLAALTGEEGQDLIEYALLAGLISIVAVVSITAAGSSVSTLFSSVAAAIP